MGTMIDNPDRTGNMDYRPLDIYIEREAKRQMLEDAMYDEWRDGMELHPIEAINHKQDLFNALKPEFF